MNTVKIYTVALALVLTATTYANDLFPEIKGWKLKTEIAEYNPDNLWGIINGAADKYLQFNFQKLYFGVYESTDGAEINVYIYQHADINNAFGIYRNERNDDFVNNKIGTQGYTIEETVNFFKGNCYVKLYSNTKGTVTSIEELAVEISKAIKTENEWPNALLTLPKENIIEGSQLYIPKNLMGLSFMPPAFTADYKTSDEKYQVFIIERELETDCQKVFSDYLAFAKQCIPVDENTVLTITDKYNGSVYLVWKGNRIYGLAGEPSEAIQTEVTQYFLKQ